VSRIRRLLPAPGLSVLLLAVWLLLQDSAQPAQIVLGSLFALATPWFTLRLGATPPRLARPLTAARLAGVVAFDVVVSNIEVARRILGPEAAIRPGFVWVPLDLRDPTGIAILAGIVTMTPGTVSVDATPGHLLVHALHLTDAGALAAQIKRRYEAPLLEIFP
jgi:multicomponent K+:H+ antiporter subunit E